DGRLAADAAELLAHDRAVLQPVAVCVDDRVGETGAKSPGVQVAVVAHVGASSATRVGWSIARRHVTPFPRDPSPGSCPLPGPPPSLKPREGQRRSVAAAPLDELPDLLPGQRPEGLGSELPGEYEDQQAAPRPGEDQEPEGAL